MIEIKPYLSALRRDSQGSVLPMVAVASILTMALVGSGVDISRAYKTKARLQAACDAGVLAGRRTVTTAGYSQLAQDAADDYFNVNYDEDKQDTRETSFTSSSTDNGRTVNGVASTQMDMLIMKVFGHDGMEIAVDCASTMGIGNADVIMVLDTTGSMLWQADGSTSVDADDGETTRLQDLQVAMRNFYQTVADSAEGTNARIRYGFVPYTQSVNVGRLLPQDYIVNSWPIQSREPVWETKSRQEFDRWSDPVVTSSDDEPTSNGSWEDKTTGYTSSNNCNTALAALGTPSWSYYDDSTSSSTVPSNNGNTETTTTVVTTKFRKREYKCESYKDGKNTRYKIRQRWNYKDNVKTTKSVTNKIYKTITWEEFDKWAYKQITYDVSQYKALKTAMIPDPSLSKGDKKDEKNEVASGTWPGCIEERQTSNDSSFSFSTITGMSPDVADLDIDSVPDSDATRWAPMWPDVSFYRTNSKGSLTNDATSSYGGAGAYGCPAASQNLQVMTQDEFNAYVGTLSAKGGTYHDIGMAWGGRLLSPDGIFSSIVNEAPDNGGNVARHLIFMTDGVLDTGNTIQSAWGLEYHDRRITSDGSKSQSDTRHRSRFLALCEAVKAKGIRLWVIAFGTSLTTDLQTCSSGNSSFHANTPALLDEKFQEIAKQVGELRMTQ